MTINRTRKFTRSEAEEALRYLYGLYRTAPAYLGHYLYLVQLESSLNPSRRLPSQTIINKYWPNVRDAWLSLDITPSYELSGLDTGFQVDEETDGQLRRIYSVGSQRRDRYPLLRRLALTCSIPVPALALRAVQLGLDSRTHIEWTDEETTILKSCAHLSRQQIARALAVRGFRRNCNTNVIVRARREQLHSSAPSHYSLQRLAGLFGIDSHSVKRWLSEGWLLYEMKGTERTRQQGGDTYLVSREAVRAFVCAYPELFDLRKVNQSWFIDLVREGAHRSVEPKVQPDSVAANLSESLKVEFAAWREGEGHV